MKVTEWQKIFTYIEKIACCVHHTLSDENEIQKIEF